MKQERFEAHLFEPATGKRTIYPFNDHLEDDGTYNAFGWSDGNFSCDCNRRAFLDGNGDLDHPCGDGGVIVEKIVAADRPDVILYSEDAP